MSLLIEVKSEIDKFIDKVLYGDLLFWLMIKISSILIQERRGEMNGFRVENSKCNRSFDHLKKLVFFQDTIVSVYDMEISDSDFETEVKNCLKSDIKNHPLFQSRDHLIMRNIGPNQYFLAAVAYFPPLKEKISIFLDSEPTELELEYELSPFEIWLESLSQIEREKYFKPVFHPSRRDSSLSNYSKTKEELKKSFILEQSVSKTNVYTQNGVYENIITDMIGKEVLEKCKEEQPIKYYQLIELLSCMKNHYGFNFKPIFERLKNDLSFELSLKPNPTKFSIPTSNEEQIKALNKKYRDSYRFDKQNSNVIPALLKELMALCLDSVELEKHRTLIRLLPDIVDKLIDLQELVNSKAEFDERYRGYFKSMGYALNDSNNVFTQFAFNLQLRLIGIKYRTKFALWKDILGRISKKLDEKQNRKLIKKFEKQITDLNRNKTLDLTNKEHIYSDRNKFAFQVLGALALTKNFKPKVENIYIGNELDNIAEFSEPHFPNLLTVINMLLRENETSTIKTTNHFLNKYSTSHTKGKTKISSELLRELERASRLAMSCQGNLRAIMDRTHVNYWELLFIQTKINENHASRKSDYGYKDTMSEYTKIAWRCFSKTSLLLP